MAQAPDNNDNNNNNNNNNNGVPSKVPQTKANFLFGSTNLANNAVAPSDNDIDNMGFGRNTVTKGAPGGGGTMMYPRQMQPVNSYDAPDQIIPDGNVWFRPKTIHPQRSQPKDEMQNKQASYTFGDTNISTKTSNTTDGMTMPLVPSRLAEKTDINVKGYDVVIVNNNENETQTQTQQIQESTQTQQEQTNIITNIQNINDINNESKTNTNNIDENETKTVGYSEPIDNWANDTNITPVVFNSDFVSSDAPSSRLRCDDLKKWATKGLNEFVGTGFIDWSYSNRYQFEGRVYKLSEDCGFRITIYEFEEDSTDLRTVLDVRRNGGDSFLFQEFRNKYLSFLSENYNAIDYSQSGLNFTMEHGFMEDDFSELPPLSPTMDAMSDNMSDLDDMGDDFLSYQSPFSSVSNTETGVFNAEACVTEATDFVKPFREYTRECVSILKNASDDSNKLEELCNVDNVIERLLEHISGKQQIYDTYIIKSYLEVIYKIISFDIKKINTVDELKIREINAQWKNIISHPFDEKITGFFPSQQIQLISYKCIQLFSNSS